MSNYPHVQLYIDGHWREGAEARKLPVLNPATGEAWCEIPEATAEDVNRAVEAAHRAFSEGPWARMLPSERGRLLRRLADLLAAKSEELGRIETVDTGKMLKETRWQAKYIAEFYDKHTALSWANLMYTCGTMVSQGTRELLLIAAEELGI